MAVIVNILQYTFLCTASDRNGQEEEYTGEEFKSERD
jgi:hypothetical protein